MARMLLAVLLVATVGAEQVSPIAKIVELLDACKAKTQADLDEEAKGMEKYSKFCDDTVNDKKYAIETADRAIEDLSATIEDATASTASLSETIEDLGMDIAEHSKDLNAEIKEREEDHATFTQAEKNMVEQIEMLSSATELLKSGQSFIQGGKGKQWTTQVVTALSAIADAEGIETGTKEKLQSFLQAAKASPSADEDDDGDEELALTQQMHGQPAPAVKNFESQGGPIIDILEKIQERTEARLSDTRAKEMSDQHSFEKVKQGLENELAHAQEKHATATQNKAVAIQTKEEANQKMTDTKNSKAADEEYKSTLALECQTKAREWEERLRSGNGEIAAIEKAKEIMRTGVKVFAQVSVATRRASDSSDDALRARLTASLRGLAESRHSFALNQLAVAAGSDPFGKVRGLIEHMITKLMTEAEEAATKEAFCQEEMSKSEKSKADKTAEMEKHKTRMDSAATQIAELTEAIRTLESEIAEIDRTNAEAKEMRNTEHAQYLKASKDYSESAEAVARAIEVLKSYYEGSFIQTNTRELKAVAGRKSSQPTFGGQQDSSGVIAIMEVAQEDFTNQLAETESAESEAVAAFDKLMKENQLARSTKAVEAKGKSSEVKSLKTGLSHNTEDYEGVSKELDTVVAYLNKLKPECASKVMSYAEKKAAREAEIAGLKDALDILSGDGVAMVQVNRRLRVAH